MYLDALSFFGIIITTVTGNSKMVLGNHNFCNQFLLPVKVN
jgi:hypothetical protein